MVYVQLWIVTVNLKLSKSNGLIAIYLSDCWFVGFEYFVCAMRAYVCVCVRVSRHGVGATTWITCIVFSSSSSSSLSLQRWLRVRISWWLHQSNQTRRREVDFLKFVTFTNLDEFWCNSVSAVTSMHTAEAIYDRCHSFDWHVENRAHAAWATCSMYSIWLPTMRRHLTPIK